MISIRKLSVFCVLLCALKVSADVSGQVVGGEACLVQLLKAMRKLNADFRSNTRVPAPLVCYYMTELTMQMLKSTVFGEVNATMPSDAECVTKEFVAQATLFHVLKIRLIDGSRTLNDTEKQNQLLEARSELTDNLRTVAEHCQTDKEKVINVFQRDLGIKNETLEAHQTEYCLAKYAVDNQLLALVDVDINPHKIDSETVNCDDIIKVEKSHFEREIRNMVVGMPIAAKSLDCIMDAYKSSTAIHSQIALKVLDYLDISKETKGPMQDSNSRAFRNIFSTSIRECGKAAKSKTE